MSELPLRAPGANPSVRTRCTGAIAPIHARPLPAASRLDTRPRPRAGRTSASRAGTVEPIEVADARCAPEAPAEPWQPPITQRRPTHARDGWAA